MRSKKEGTKEEEEEDEEEEAEEKEEEEGSLHFPGHTEEEVMRRAR